MNIEIKYNDTDITNLIDLKSCILTDRYGGLLDSIKMVINDADKNWCNYGVSKGDEIIITTDGYSTGKMYLTQFEHRKDTAIIDAVSLKPSKKEVRSKIWRNVSLSNILVDCAKSLGLMIKMYGVSDFYYTSIAQIKKTDLEFVSMVCKREGYSVKVDDDSLVVFNEHYLESQETDLTITPSDIKDGYSFINVSNCTNNLTISYYDLDNGLMEYRAVDETILGESKVINEKISSYDEAKRFAYGYLRDCNKKHITGYMTMPYNPSISAGTVFKAKGFDEFDGKYVVSEVSHNAIKELSSLTIRKVLYY